MTDIRVPAVTGHTENSSYFLSSLPFPYYTFANSSAQQPHKCDFICLLVPFFVFVERLNKLKMLCVEVFTFDGHDTSLPTNKLAN